MNEPEQNRKALTALENLLERAEAVDTIESLLGATAGNAGVSSPSLKGSAICIDTNVFIRLANMEERAQVIDYLASQHGAPIVVSAQALQEVWNNYLNGVETIAGEIKSKFDALCKAVAGLEAEFSDYKVRFDNVLAEFRDEFGHLYNPGLSDRVRTLFEMLRKRAMFSEVPRRRFECYASVRKRTKTPPGFKDDGDGDYFIWLDFLYGLRLAKERGEAFDRAILVSGDRKIDWVKGGVAHPTLAAECLKFVGVPLEIWTLKRLIESTKESSL